MAEPNNGWIYRARVAADAAGASVLAFHVARYRHSDEVAWREAIDLGRVLVNGRRVRPEQPLAAGDELEFHRPPWREPEAPESFAVAFEDEHVLVVVKPADLQVLPAGPFSARTLLELVRASDASRREAAPAHRLGRGTSGLIAFGKTALGRSSLSRQLRELTLGKTYLAWIAGARLPTSFAARQPIARIPHGPLTIHAAAAHGRRVVDARARAAPHGRADARRRAADHGPARSDPHPSRGGRRADRRRSAVRAGRRAEERRAAGRRRLLCCIRRGSSFDHPHSGARIRLRSRPDWLADERGVDSWS